MMHWTNRYVGIPFANVGSSQEGCNCWGLVRLVLANECLISDLPAYAEISAEDVAATARQMAHDRTAAPWLAVAQPKPFDVALMYAMHGKVRIAGHVGIMSSQTHVLHVWRATAAVHMPISHHRVRHKLIGFYRHESLNE